MNAIVISCGNELVTGQTVDTNSAYISRRLGRYGIAAIEHLTVGDDRAAIAQAISQAAARVDLVIVTGGLGPTADDLSRHALADAMNAQLVLDPGSLARIEEFFRARDRAMSPENRVQAMIPAGGHAMENSAGTAPGIAAMIGRCRVYVLPGVPFEMRWMFERVVEPQLPAGTGVVLHRTIHTFGAGESDVGARIADLMARDANPLVGTTVAAGLVSIRITARAERQADAERLCDAAADEIRARLGTLVFGQDDQTMASAVGELLRARRQTLATAESCTGGLIGQLITAVPGSSDYYRGGVVAYADMVKSDLLGVAPELIARDGAVSESVAAAMAEGCRGRFAADWTLSITGIAGPGGGTAAKPVGLAYIGLAGPSLDVAVHRHVLAGDREIIRLRSALAALNHLRLAMI